MKITLKMLEDTHAADNYQLDVFAKEWPQGFTVDQKSIARAIELRLDVDWAIENLLSAAACAKYDQAIAPAKAKYNETTSTIKEEYYKAIAPIMVEFHKNIVSADTEGGKGLVAVWEVHNRAMAPAREEFGKATAAAREEYSKSIVSCVLLALTENELINDQMER